MTILTATDLAAAKVIIPVPLYNARGRRTGTEYEAEFDGEYLGTYAEQWQAQRALDDHALRLIEDGVLDGAAVRS